MQGLQIEAVKKETFRSKAYIIWQVLEKLQAGDTFTARDIKDLIPDNRISLGNIGSYLHWLFTKGLIEKKSKIVISSGHSVIGYEMVEKPPEPVHFYPEHVRRQVDSRISGNRILLPLQERSNQRFPIHLQNSYKIGDVVPPGVMIRLATKDVNIAGVVQKLIDLAKEVEQITSQDVSKFTDDQLIAELYRRKKK